MDVAGVSMTAKTQTAFAPSAGAADQNGNGGSSGGWKFITVQEGDTVYTYVVIGKNMRVLVGKTTVHDDQDADKDKKSENSKKASSSQAADQNTTEKNTDGQTKENKVDFLTDSRMFALTAVYQKKMRETMKNMVDHVGMNDRGVEKVSGIGAKKKAENDSKESGV